MGPASAVVVAAGRGERFGAEKAFVFLRGRPLVEWSVEAFDRHSAVDEVVIVVAAGRVESAAREFKKYGKVSAVVAGGQERQDSVLEGFRRVRPGAERIVLVHDGARPLLSQDLISRVVSAAAEKKAAVPGLPVEETVKEFEDGRVIKTIDRSKLIRVQTPQGFLYDVLESALEEALQAGFRGTDEAMLVERLGRIVTLVPGDPRNIKVTTPDDLVIAEALSES